MASLQRESTLERTRLALQLELAGARAQRAALPLQAEREGSQLRRASAGGSLFESTPQFGR